MEQSGYVAQLVEWVNSLSPSAAQFWGAVVGVGGGLTAILTGAFVNAVLNRRRDDRLRGLEGRAVAAAIRGELSCMKLSIQDLLPIWREGQSIFSEAAKRRAAVPGGADDPVDAREYARLPPADHLIYEAIAPRLGSLGSDLAGAITVIYTNYRVRSEIFDQPFQILSTDLPMHFAEQIAWGEKFCTDCADIERFLMEFEKTGKSASLAAEIRKAREDGPKTP